jgi:hypothetical protein
MNEFDWAMSALTHDAKASDSLQVVIVFSDGHTEGFIRFTGDPGASMLSLEDFTEQYLKPAGADLLNRLQR